MNTDTTTLDRLFDEAIGALTEDLRAERLTVDEWSAQLREMELEYREHLDCGCDR